ncbi:prenyltransferase/squalene oxidase repeat-containing protein [Arthrobacter halodurans]
MGKTLALFSLAAGLQGDEQLAQRLVDTLLAESDGGPWGYEFDVQTRWSYYPKGVPNVVATAFALRAIDAAGRINDVSARTSEWLNSLYDARGYFHYTPTSDSLIHNGSLLAAEALTRLGYSSTYCQTAIDTTVAHQAPGGAWAYGSSESLAWRDSFHTVYVLDSLQYLGQRGFNIGEAYEAGRRYWLDHFFLPDGRATYFADGKRPSNDVHNLATVAGALIRHKVDGHHAHLQDRVYAQLMARQGRDGGYRNSSTSQAFLRWNQGHAYLALALGAQDEE